ncbi:MAG: hypothetical protein ACLPWF_26145 [Bryobacteraceae bacterium]
MRLLMLMGAFLSSGVLAQAQGLTHQHALDDNAFQSCDEVLNRAVALSADIRESAYVMELFPKSRGTAAYPFPSEVTAASAASWIASHDTKSIPAALFYFVKGAYTLRCRDNQGKYVRLSGPFGAASPLVLNVGVGTGEIWYFFRNPLTHNAFVYVVTDVPLKSLSEPDEIGLMNQVKELLDARFVQAIYLRNEPWFLGTAPNSLIYLFADAFPRMTLEEYKATKTLWCNQNQGCKFYLLY